MDARRPVTRGELAKALKKVEDEYGKELQMYGFDEWDSNDMRRADHLTPKLCVVRDLRKALGL